MNVVLTKYSLAGWWGDVGSASNGLGDPEILGSYSGVSSGTHYELRSNPGWDFDVEITPSAVVATAGPDPMNVASAYVWTTVTASPVLCNISGGKPSGWLNYFMVGQGCTSSGECDGFSLSNFNWFIPGYTFKDFIIGPGQTYGYPEYLQAYDYHLSTPHWYWRIGSGLQQTVQFNAQCWAGFTYIGTVSARRKVIVKDPENFSTNTDKLADVNYLANSWPNFSVHLGPFHSDFDAGIVLLGYAETPSFMYEGDNRGFNNWGQLLYFNDTGSNFSWVTAGFVLDNAWPYPYSIPSQASPNTACQFEDSPSNPLGNSTWFNINEEFESYFFYTPPGTDVRPVNLRRTWWGWQSEGSRANYFQSFSPDPPSGFKTSFHQDWRTHADWIDVFHNP